MRVIACGNESSIGAAGRGEVSCASWRFGRVLRATVRPAQCPCDCRSSQCDAVACRPTRRLVSAQNTAGAAERSVGHRHVVPRTLSRGTAAAGKAGAGLQVPRHGKPAAPPLRRTHQRVRPIDAIRLLAYCCGPCSPLLPLAASTHARKHSCACTHISAGASCIVQCVQLRPNARSGMARYGSKGTRAHVRCCATVRGAASTAE